MRVNTRLQRLEQALQPGECQYCRLHMIVPVGPEDRDDAGNVKREAMLCPRCGRYREEAKALDRALVEAI
jgi:hypothetical protein